jgi:hypothetical protein
MIKKSKLVLFSIFTFYIFFSPLTSVANERKFTYVYQSSVLEKDSKELEIWTTPRLGKSTGYYAGLDNRVEFEVGLAKHLQSAFYINFSNVTSDNGTGENSTKFNFKGISTEFKYQFSNPYTNTLGFALYGELGLNTDKVELETKLIFDKKIKQTTLALNLTAEPEWELTPGKSENEWKFGASFGLSYDIGSSFSAGFELRNENVLEEGGGLEHSALFGGPVVSYSASNWWMAFTVMPQIVGFKGKSAGSELNLTEFEKFESRLIFSFEI